MTVCEQALPDRLLVGERHLAPEEPRRERGHVAECNARRWRRRVRCPDDRFGARILPLPRRCARPRARGNCRHPTATMRTSSGASGSPAATSGSCRSTTRRRLPGPDTGSPRRRRPTATATPSSCSAFRQGRCWIPAGCSRVEVTSSRASSSRRSSSASTYRCPTASRPRRAVSSPASWSLQQPKVRSVGSR